MNYKNNTWNAVWLFNFTVHMNIFFKKQFTLIVLLVTASLSPSKTTVRCIFCHWKIKHDCNIGVFFFFFSNRDNVAVADIGNMQLEAQHAFTHRRQISEDTENLDSRDSPEVKTTCKYFWNACRLSPLIKKLILSIHNLKLFLYIYTICSLSLSLCIYIYIYFKIFFLVSF